MILGIYGSGGLGREVLDLAKVINTIHNKWDKIVFINDFKQEAIVNGARVYTLNEFQSSFSPNNTRTVIAVGEPKIRKILRQNVIERGYELQSLIHPTAFIGAETEIADGVVLQFGSFVSCNTKIDENVYLQTGVCIGHDCHIKADTVISPYSVIAGSCVIGERVYIGMGVPIKENISVGSDTIVGMGSVVNRDIPENVIAMGNPARSIKHNDSGRVFK